MFKFDPVLWNEAYLDTPLATLPAGLTHDEALTTPGCYVKARIGGALDTSGRPLLGRLVSITEGIALVRSNEPYHNGAGKPFVWSGSVASYFTTWRCD